MNNDTRKVLHVLYNRGTTSGMMLKKESGVENLKKCINELLQHCYITIGGNFGVLTEEQALNCYACWLPSHKWEIEQELQKLFATMA